ncbi:hypothetical protein PpBr36_08368 [Pyricularia pennisetigena]|uniref:hypothetical protein n=1 Tax=Pyricularia pennisetigena TaxID=1578925 RepID=UPI00114DD672|nr:hypothetical protein PpBr36_08368 [Pyricularia pennisetigena]TLS24601.1 hypothetical protein PpBr36_08368 [Pyricularia pennisetigena]
MARFCSSSKFDETTQKESTGLLSSLPQTGNVRSKPFPRMGTRCVKATVLALVRCGKALAPNIPWRYTALARVPPDSAAPRFCWFAISRGNSGTILCIRKLWEDV